MRVWSHLVARLRRGARHARQLAQRSASEFIDDGGTQLGASVSYFTLLALFPLVILGVAVFGLFLGGDEARDRVVELVLDRLPLREEEGRRDLRESLTAVTSSAATFGVVGVASLFVAASGLMASIRSGLNRAWDTSDSRPPIRGKALDILLVLAVGLVIALSLGLTLISRLAVSVGEDVGEALGPVGSAIPRLLLAVGQLTPVVVSFAVFAFLYRVVPATDVRLRDVWPGALIAALGFELVKTGFSFYLENLADYGAVYGSLATVVAFLVFVFLTASVMVLGAEAASEWAHVRDGRQDAIEAAGPQVPLGTRLRGFARSLVRGE